MRYTNFTLITKSSDIKYDMALKPEVVIFYLLSQVIKELQ